jgi:hypothetical protein
MKSWVVNRRKRILPSCHKSLWKLLGEGEGADKLSVFYFSKFGGVLRHISSSAEIAVSLRGVVTKVHIQDTRFRSQVCDLQDTV